jgi:cell division initiation protein
MEITSSDIGRKNFTFVRRGFDPQEVTLFLENVAIRLAQRERDLADVVDRMQRAEAALAEARSAEEAVRLTLIAATETKQRLSDDAQRKADEVVGTARAEAERLRRESSENAESVVSQARREALRLLEVSRTEAADVLVSAREEHESLLAGAAALQTAIAEVTHLLQGIAGGTLAELKMAADRLASARQSPRPTSDVTVVTREGEVPAVSEKRDDYVPDRT